MRCGTNYRVKVHAPAGVVLDMDLHEIVLKLYGSGYVRFQAIDQVEIEIERDGVRVEKRLPAWLEYEEG